jgi:hypothetical protein
MTEWFLSLLEFECFIFKLIIIRYRQERIGIENWGRYKWKLMGTEFIGQNFHTQRFFKIAGRCMFASFDLFSTAGKYVNKFCMRLTEEYKSHYM